MAHPFSCLMNTGPLSPGVKRQYSQVHRSPPSSSRVNNECGKTSTPSRTSRRVWGQFCVCYCFLQSFLTAYIKPVVTVIFPYIQKKNSLWKPVQRIQLRGNRTDEMEVQNGTRNRQIVGRKKNVYFISFGETSRIV